MYLYKYINTYIKLYLWFLDWLMSLFVQFTESFVNQILLIAPYVRCLLRLSIGEIVQASS